MDFEGEKTFLWKKTSFSKRLHCARFLTDGLNITEFIPMKEHFSHQEETSEQTWVSLPNEYKVWA